jgi:protein ImuB
MPALADIAQEFSPRFEIVGDETVIDVTGLDRLLGSPRVIGEELRRTAAARGLRVHVAVAATRMAALVLARTRPGLTVVDRGGAREALAAVSVDVIQIASGWGGEHVHPAGEPDAADSLVAVLRKWGIKTLGGLAALPPDDLAARLGAAGPVWQAMARGEDVRPLVPSLPEERFESSVDLEWPIEGLEPLSFVLTRLLEPLSTRLERRDRGAAGVHVMLGLVRNSEAGEAGRAHQTSLQLPTPMRDVRTLRTLILLDLESHPPPAAIERVSVLVEPTPGRVLQHALFTRAQPAPEQLSTLLARLSALMGQDRLGCPRVEDSYRPGAFAMMPFATDWKNPIPGKRSTAGDQRPTTTSLRRCRRPVPARVSVTEGKPVFVTTDRRGFSGGRVLTCSGPWRTSGEWWRGGWDRDEWDVALGDGMVCRIFRDRTTDGWFIDAIVD